MTNPYNPPQTTGTISETPEKAKLVKLAKAQKLILYAILLNLSTLVIQFVPLLVLLVIPIGITCLVMSIIGIIRMAICLGSSVGIRVVYIICMFVPLINLIALLILNSKATKMLREGGYKVGLMGANI